MAPPSPNPALHQSSARPSQPANDHLYVSFGSGTRYFTEDYYLKQLSPLGLNRRSFRALCRALGVPLLFIGRSVLIDLLSFQLALRAVSRVGQPDFVAPSAVLDENPKTFRKRKRLDIAYFRENYDIFIKEILNARTLRGLPAPETLSSDMSAAAKRLIETSLRLAPLSAQEALL